MIELYEYELPFRTPFNTASGVFTIRKGILIRLLHSDADYVVEASPLPGFSEETISEVRNTLLGQKKLIEKYLSQPLNLKKIKELSTIEVLKYPSIQFGLSYLALQVAAKQQDSNMYELLGVKQPESLAINDVIGHNSLYEMRKQIEQSIQQGFSVLKIKAPHPIDGLSRLLHTIHNEHPSIQFRIDANQSWPENQFIKNCKMLEGLPVQYIEEPCNWNFYSGIPEIMQNSRIPIALDESIDSIQRLKQVLNRFPEIYIIMKPVLLGNILKIHETISQYRSNFKHTVVTTTLESNIGRSMIASTASLIGDPKMSHGLHTGHLFADDLLPDFEIKNGLINNLLKNPAVESFSQIKTSYIKQLR